MLCDSVDGVRQSVRRCEIFTGFGRHTRSGRFKSKEDIWRVWDEIKWGHIGCKTDCVPNLKILSC